jgi:ATP10 protein
MTLKFSLLLISLCILAMPAAPERLQTGAALPAIKGETLAGEKVELPAAFAGANRILVFSFSKAASSDSRLWTEHLAKDLGPDSPVVVVRVIMLESAPRLVRGMAVSGIKSGIPKPLWGKTILSYTDEKSWKDRLAVSNDKHSYIIVINGEGQVRWVGSEAFSDSSYSHLKESLPH